MIKQNKVWRIGLFAFNNSASNSLSVLMGYYALYTQNVLMLGVIMASLIMPMRIFDGITDPIAGNILDKLNTKYGRYRPYMVIGNAIAIMAVLTIFWFPLNSTIPTIVQQIIMVLLYAIYIIGFTLQTTATRAGQALVTSDPKQRPWYTLFDACGTGITIGVVTILITGNILSDNMYDIKVWHIVSIIVVILSITYTYLACIGISTRDIPEYYMTGRKEKIRFSEFIHLFKRNKPLRRLIYAASSDKLAAQLKGLVMIYFFSNIVLKSSINAVFSVLSGVVGVIIVAIGSKFAMKKGTTNAFVKVSIMEVISSFIPFILCLIFIPIGTTTFSGVNFGLILILVIYCFYIGLTGLSTNLIFPMLGDISDYELLTTNKFIPGTIASMFSFVDKLISSFAGLIVTIIMLISGFSSGRQAVVEQNQYINSTFYLSILIAIFIIPCIGHIISVIAMKNYPLTEKRMDEIAGEISELKQALKLEEQTLTNNNVTA